MILTHKHAAQMLQVSEEPVMRWVQTEGLPAQTVQDRIQFDRIALLEWAWRNKRPICPSVGIAVGGGGLRCSPRRCEGWGNSLPFTG